jgi:glycosyltransferase involved in cell wall biosynthesis
MKVLMVSKSSVVAAHHGKLEELVRMGVDLTLIVPPRWGSQPLEVRQSELYKIRVLPCLLTPYPHFHFYPARIGTIDADVVYLEEEPWSLVTHQFVRLCVKARKPVIFTTWQTIYKRYPPPFSYFERYTFAHAGAAIAGNKEAAEMLRTRGFAKPVSVISYGLYPEVFYRRDGSLLRQKLGFDDSFVIGYVGRVIAAKGIADLIQAFALLPQHCRLLIVGDGDFRGEGNRIANSLGVHSRVRWVPQIPSLEVPDYLSVMDALVLPSRTTARWKEQFGRVLIEAMACETPPVGSDSGEIPNVIGDAGLVFREGDVSALVKQLLRLLQNPRLAAELGKRGRARVLEHFTQKTMAQEVLKLCQKVLLPCSDMEEREAVQIGGAP